LKLGNLFSQTSGFFPSQQIR